MEQPPQLATKDDKRLVRSKFSNKQCSCAAILHSYATQVDYSWPNGLLVSVKEYSK